MAKFERWKHAWAHTGPFRVYKQYYLELNQYYWAAYSGHKITYTEMAKKGYTWESSPDEILGLPQYNHTFPTLRDWATAYDQLQVWIRLNAVISLTSIFETYLDSVCGLAIESNPGILINASKSLDGVSLLKTKRLDRELINKAIEEISKGTWPQRRSAFDSLFGGHPVEWDTYEADLEELRQKRNSVGHAFGRDINKARQFEEITPLPLEGIRQEKLIHYFDITLKVASAIDQYLLDNHIGEYQALFSFHVFYTHHQDEDWDDEEMSKSFRKFLLMDKRRYGKQFFIDLVKYYKIA